MLWVVFFNYITKVLVSLNTGMVVLLITLGCMMGFCLITTFRLSLSLKQQEQGWFKASLFPSPPRLLFLCSHSQALRPAAVASKAPRFCFSKAVALSGSGLFLFLCRG